MRNILNNKFKPLHKLPINSAEAAEVITLKLHELLMAPVTNCVRKDRGIGLRWLVAPTAARAMKDLAYNIGQRAHALKVLPIGVANPAGLPLDVLLTDRQPKGGHLAAVPYDQVPALFAKLVEFSQPAHDYFTCTEAACAIGTPVSYINKVARTGELPAIRSDASLPAQIAAGIIPYEWRIQPADLYALRPMVVDVIPGVRPVIFDSIDVLRAHRPAPERSARNAMGSI